MKFDPNDAYNCLPAGEYDAVLADMEETQSKKSGADMVVLSVDIYDASGARTRLSDYIVAPHNGKKGNVFRLKGIGAAFNRPADEWKCGDTAWLRECLGKSVKVELTIEEQQGFEPKNRIEGYSPSAKAPPAAAAKRAPALNHEPVREDDIPFDLAHKG